MSRVPGPGPCSPAPCCLYLTFSLSHAPTRISSPDIPRSSTVAINIPLSLSAARRTFASLIHIYHTSLSSGIRRPWPSPPHNLPSLIYFGYTFAGCAPALFSLSSSLGFCRIILTTSSLYQSLAIYTLLYRIPIPPHLWFTAWARYKRPLDTRGSPWCSVSSSLPPLSVHLVRTTADRCSPRRPPYRTSPIEGNVRTSVSV